MPQGEFVRYLLRLALRVRAEASAECLCVRLSSPRSAVQAAEPAAALLSCLLLPGAQAQKQGHQPGVRQFCRGGTALAVPHPTPELATTAYREGKGHSSFAIRVIYYPFILRLLKYNEVLLSDIQLH